MIFVSRILSKCPGVPYRDGVIAALLTAQHALEMFRRALPDGASRTSLARLSNRLTKIITEARKLTIP